MRACVTWMMCRTLLTCRLPARSSRCRFGRPSPSPDERRNRGCAAPAGELGLGAEPGRVADLSEQGHRGDDADADQLGERAAEGGEQVRDLMVDLLELDVDRVHGVAGGEQPGELEPVGRSQAALVKAQGGQRCQCGHDAAGGR